MAGKTPAAGPAFFIGGDWASFIAKAGWKSTLHCWQHPPLQASASKSTDQIKSQTCAVWCSEPFTRGLCYIHWGNELWQRSALTPAFLGENQLNVTAIIKNRQPKLRKASQPPLSHPGAAPDSDRARKPRLAEPVPSDHELKPGDRVEGVGNFGEPTGEFGTVERTNEEDAVVKWDDDGRVRLHQPQLKKCSSQIRRLKSEPCWMQIVWWDSWNVELTAIHRSACCQERAYLNPKDNYSEADSPSFLIFGPMESTFCAAVSRALRRWFSS